MDITKYEKLYEKKLMESNKKPIEKDSDGHFIWDSSNIDEYDSFMEFLFECWDKESL